MKHLHTKVMEINRKEIIGRRLRDVKLVEEKNS